MHHETHRIRQAVQAGRFYPSAPVALGRMIEGFVGQARHARMVSPKAVIAPHAGYQYSGPIAGSAFAAWSDDAHRISRIILIGPSHWIDFRGLALPEATAFATPLGQVPLDISSVEELQKIPAVHVYNPAHEREHALEVELPFLQWMLPEFTLIPLVVGNASDAEIEEVLTRIWGGDETRFVLSSDLSHYLSYEEARRMDGFTASVVEGLEPEGLSARHACGYRAIRAFLRAARRQGVSAETVDLRNSGDTAGSRESVVGYGAFAFG